MVGGTGSSSCSLPKMITLEEFHRAAVGHRPWTPLWPLRSWTPLRRELFHEQGSVGGVVRADVAGRGRGRRRGRRPREVCGERHWRRRKRRAEGMTSRRPEHSRCSRLERRLRHRRGCDCEEWGVAISIWGCEEYDELPLAMAHALQPRRRPRAAACGQASARRTSGFATFRD